MSVPKTGRFDAEDLVTAWRERGEYPKIHTAMTAWVRENVDPREGPVLDLCSSTGLLGRRLAAAGYTVRAVELPGPALQLGRSHGIYEYVPVMSLKIERDTLEDLGDWLRATVMPGHDPIRTVVARRAFPELWDSLDGAEGLSALGRLLAECGVRNVLLEGRAHSKRTTHPLGEASAEVNALAESWRVLCWRGPLYHLVPRA